MSALIYHGTPMTPRAALRDVCAGRAMCVSFYRPDDVEVVEAISPAIMYDNGAFSFWQQALRAGHEWAEERDWMPFLSMAGAAPVSSGEVGDHPGHAGGTEPTQRRAPKQLALWPEGRAAVAHGQSDQSFAATVREIQSCLSRMDGPEGWITRLSRSNGRGSQGARQPLASDPYDARNCGGVRLPIRQRGQHISGAERLAL